MRAISLTCGSIPVNSGRRFVKCWELLLDSLIPKFSGMLSEHLSVVRRERYATHTHEAESGSAARSLESAREVRHAYT